MNTTYKMRMGGRMVEVSRDGSGWLASTGNIFADSWQNIWCETPYAMLALLELISREKGGKVPNGCHLLTKKEADSHPVANFTAKVDLSDASC